MTAADIARALRPLLGDRLLRPDDDGYDGARRVWNAAVTSRPAAVARCRDAAEVAAVVRAAREARQPLSVRAGGHDWAGRAVRDGGVVVDLTGMRAVTVDAAAGVAVVAGGATGADLLAAAQPHGLAAVTGVEPGVGMAGFTTGGGYGPLIGRCGLGADNLLSAEVVLADGSIVTAGPDGDAELWWALRGGGGNFGVVTSMQIRLQPVALVLAGILMFPIAEAAAVLDGYAGIVADAPDELTVMTGFLPGPHGPTVFLCPVWCGDDLAAGERHVGRLRALGHPFVDQVGPMPVAAAVGMFAGNAVAGNHYLLRSTWVPDLAGVAAEALAAGAAAVSSPYSVLFVSRLHGAAARVDPAATAFAHRRPHQVIEMIAVWAPDDPAPQRHREWAEATAEALAPVALPGAYPNQVGPDEDERARASFGVNLARVLAAKRQYDPAGIFSAIPGLL
ncbi:FAD-binding oxidoreductase [Dactylosporangium vinaceum]|uniref:FAD-binding oxidoreductase n=1 Tax=Dactylosporangium vinaceum TaxID=53362 RepID=A0ABV5MIQ9_9ACTN|nr:FAD-binding oxidoreductase [Dactylosporangium vinaceum]UAB93818.1 FAD-binding oxidoreductase [Dactylosporangium vinaceum]